MTSHGWKASTFGELVARKVLLVSDGYRAKNEELGGDGVIFLRAGHLSDSQIDLTGVDRFRSEHESRVVSKLSRAGDVMVTTKGNSTGRVGYVSPDMPRFVYSPHLSFWRSLDEGVIYPGFLRAWSRSPEFRQQLQGLSVGTDMAPYLSLSDQMRLVVTLPPIDQQRTIAHILGTLDDKIELNRRLSQTLEERARALFTSWFVDFDPVRAKAAGRQPEGMEAETSALFPSDFEESELGPVPAGWSTHSLDSIAQFTNGLAMQRYPAVPPDPGLPVIKIAQLRKGTAGDGPRASSELASSYIVSDGDVLFSWSGSLEVVVWGGGPGALNQHLFKVTSEKVPTWFYYFWLHHHLPWFRGIAVGKATTMGHIQRRHLTEAKIVLPSSELLRAVDACLGPVLDRILQCSLESRLLVQARDDLLPKLISGELQAVQASDARPEL